jgi:alpha-glucosidase
MRSYELRLPDDWPPASVTVNGKPVSQGGVGKLGWTYEGNTLTTVIPTASFSTASRVTIKVRRDLGLLRSRANLDGFAGAMTRLRGAYDALQQTLPAAVPPEALIDAMQTGDRLSYHPERATAEIAHFHEVLPQAQAAVAALDANFEQRLDDAARRIGGSGFVHVDIEAEKQRRRDALHRAESLLAETEK